MHPAEGDPGLARERTALAWRRTAMTQLVTGLVLVRITETLAVRVGIGALVVVAAAMAAVAPQRHGRRRLATVAAATVAVALLGAYEVARTSSA